MGIRHRGVQEIRTLASVLGTGVHSNERHVHQFQLASLELERTRRTRERKAACERIRGIDARLAEIGELIRKHQEALGVGAPEEQIHGQQAARTSREVATEKRRVLRY